MRQRVLAFSLVMLFAARGLAAGEDRVVFDVWYESGTSQGKTGYLHIQAKEVRRNGQTLIHTVAYEEFSYLRSKDPYVERVTQETVETPCGEVVEIGYKMSLSKRQDLHIRGTPTGKELVLRIVDRDGRPTPYRQRVSWEPAALGILAQERFFAGKLLQLGDVYQLPHFSINVHAVVTQTVKVKEVREFGLGRARFRLAKLEQSYPPELYLGQSTAYVSGGGQIVCVERDIALFGLVRYVLSTKEQASARFVPRVADREAPIGLGKPITFRNGMPRELTVRVSLEGIKDPREILTVDGRQRLVKVSEGAIEVQLLTEAPLNRDAPPRPPPAEYLESNFFIRCDDPEVQKLARKAVADEIDPRRKVGLIRAWLQRNFTVSFEVAFATADEIARRPEGDCTEMGMLAAAMCRAQGIPSRLCFGLVYDDAHKGFGGHLWTEVYIDGNWEPFDPTGVLPGLRAAYLKISDNSMKEVLNPETLLEVRRAFSGKIRVEYVDHR